MSLRNFASVLSLIGLVILGCENNLTEVGDPPQTQPPITAPPATDPDPAQRGGAGSGDFTDPGPASPITVPDDTTTTNP
jgi:hypothetical protein